MSFHLFKQSVAARFAEMCHYPLYRTTASKDGMWEAVLKK